MTTERKPEHYEGGYIHNCNITPRAGECALFRGRYKDEIEAHEVCTAHLDGYTIIPNEQFAALESDKARLLSALDTAAEAMDERRGYADAWNWKYGPAWDEEDQIVRAALESIKRP